MEFVQPIREKKKIETIKKLLKQQKLRDYCLFVVVYSEKETVSGIFDYV